LDSVIKPIRHLAVDIKLSLREITEEAFEQCIKNYTRHTKAAGGTFEALPRDERFEIAPPGGEKITAMINKDLFKKIKHLAIDWDTDIRQITIFAFKKYLAAKGVN
jgi:hypothetical protein